MQKTTFNKDMIGKFVKLNPNPFETKINTFGVIMGFDFMSNSYIVKNIGSYFDTYTNIGLFNENVDEVYTADEVVEILHNNIDEEEKKREVLDIPFTKKIGRELRDNEKKETERLFRAYSEIVQQIDIYVKYIEMAEKNWHSEDALLYGHHLSKTKRALNRINKRFHYYFGDESKYIQQTLKHYGYCNKLQRTKNSIEENIRRYNMMIKKVKSIEKIILA